MKVGEDQRHRSVACIALCHLPHGSRASGPFAAAGIEHERPCIADDQIGGVVLRGVRFIDGKGLSVNRFHRIPLIDHGRRWAIGFSLCDVSEHVGWFHNSVKTPCKTETHAHQDHQVHASHGTYRLRATPLTCLELDLIPQICKAMPVVVRDHGIPHRPSPTPVPSPSSTSG